MANKAGAIAIIFAFRSILQDHLQTWLNDIATEQGLTALTAPDSTHGYAIGSILPRDYSPSIRLKRLRSVYKSDEAHNRAGGRRKIHTLEVVFRFGATIIDDTEQAQYIYQRAIEGAIMERYRAYFTETSIGEVLADIDAETDSIYSQDRNEGLTTRGRDAESSDTEASVIFRCLQTVYHPVTNTK